MRDAYRAARLPDDVTNHGGRYTAATIPHELDCDWDTIGRIAGQETVQMVRHYTRKRRKARPAIQPLDDARVEQRALSGALCSRRLSIGFWIGSSRRNSFRNLLLTRTANGARHTDRELGVPPRKGPRRLSM